MAELPQDWYASLLFRDLEALMAAARELPQLKQDLARCYEQLDACRSIQIEVLDKYQELYKLL
ncbi:MAG: hypothetical protein IJZ39_02680 [Oscillospiraceae bacterium]|nr:hypothetical protein [Oscillospiraceae bacterium]